MAAGFPLKLLPLLRCRYDSAELTLAAGNHEEDLISEGTLACSDCGARYPIEDGIVCMLDPGSMTGESRLEMKWRDECAGVPTGAAETPWERSVFSRLEVPQHLSALALQPNLNVLELACGRGRYTMKIAAACRAVLAVDFSFASLQVLARRAGPRIGAVQADITRFAVASGAFDRVLATTPLETREQRLAMHHLACTALRPHGRYIFSTEYDDLRTRLLGRPRRSRYHDGAGVYYRFKRFEAEGEVAPYFRKVHSRVIQVILPGIGERDLAVPLAKVVERLPLLREFGNLLLITATEPIHWPALDEVESQGSSVARFLYRTLKRP